MGLQLEIPRGKYYLISTTMNTKVVILSCLSALSLAAPSAEADAQFIAPFHGAVAPFHGAIAPVAYHPVPASNCNTTHEILVTQLCTPSAENVCTKETVDTEEIEYEKICKEVVDTICDAPIAHSIYKREAEAEADPHFFCPYCSTCCCCPSSYPCPYCCPCPYCPPRCPCCCPLCDCHSETCLS